MEQNCRFYCYRKTREPNHYKTKKTEKIELVIFDMDGVLTDIISSWKYIHDYFKTSNEKSGINHGGIHIFMAKQFFIEILLFF